VNEQLDESGIREQLAGCWRLIGYSVTSVEGCETEYPRGINPLGTILNTPDGYMSTQLAKPGLHQDD
jgi:hypothetical protein